MLGLLLARKKYNSKQKENRKKIGIKINSGIKTGYNDAFIIDQTKRDELQRPKIGAETS